MKKCSTIILVAGLSLLLFACAGGPPALDDFPEDLGVVIPVLMFGEKTEGDHDSAAFKFNVPKPIAVDAEGNIYVAGKAFDVSKFSAAGEFIMVIGSKGKAEGQWVYPKGLAVDSKGRLLVGDSKRNKVLIYDGAGSFLSEFGHDNFEDMGPLCVDADDNIYVSDGTNGVQVFDNEGNYLRSIGKVGEGKGLIGEPGWPVVNSELNKIYIADDPMGEVDVYDSESGEFLYEFGGIGEGPGKWAGDIEGLAIGPWNLIIAVDEEGGNIKIFQEDGSFVTQFGKQGLYEGEFASTESIAYDSKNRAIVVADEKNYRVQVFSLESLGF